MRKVDVIGSVRLVYYPMESDSTLIGMNVSETRTVTIIICSIIQTVHFAAMKSDLSTVIRKDVCGWGHLAPA